MLEVKGLSKRVLKNVSYKVRRGEIAIFLGASGVGKSTLLRLLANLEEPDAGEMLLDGKGLESVGMVFQQFHLFVNLTVLENITLALKKSKLEAVAIAQTLLERYGLADKAGASVKTLSGGQKQRVALARQLATSPQVICLDEPTSALDPQLTKQVAALLSELQVENRIVLLTTHDVGLLSELDAQVFLLGEGAIVEHVSTKDYFHQPTNYPKLQKFLV